MSKELDIREPNTQSKEPNVQFFNNELLSSLAETFEREVDKQRHHITNAVLATRCQFMEGNCREEQLLFVSIRREGVERWRRRKYLVFSRIALKKRGIDSRNARDSVLVAELACYLRMGEFVQEHSGTRHRMSNSNQNTEWYQTKMSGQEH